MQRTVRVVGPLRVAEVWERYAVPARWPGWAPQILSVDTDAPRIAPGVRGRVRGPAGLRVSFVVRDVDERRRTWSWDVRTGPLRMHLHHAVEPGPGGGTATSLTVRGPAAVVIAYLPVARLALRRLVRPATAAPGLTTP